MNNNKTLRYVFITLFAALISVGCFIRIPVGPGGIPIVLQNMLAILSGCILGGLDGAFSAILFVAAGAIGLPIFSGGKGGLAVITGPTGGFLVGYILGPLIAGLLIGRPSITEKSFSIQKLLQLTIAALSGYIMIYIPGVIYFMHLTGKPFAKTIAACVIPFIPGDLIKFILTVIIAAKIRPTAARYLK